MVNFANYVIKTQPQITGRWSNALWDKFTQAKKAVRDAYFKAVGKAVPDLQAEGAVNLQATHLTPKPNKYQLFRGYKSTIQGYARLQQQMSARTMRWTRGGNPFSRDYIWRRLRTGHLVGFATLFLVNEERNAKEVAFQKRSEAYGELCKNIKTLFDREADNFADGYDLSRTTNIGSFNLGKCIAVGSNGAVYEAELRNDGANEREQLSEEAAKVCEKSSRKVCKKSRKTQRCTETDSRKKIAIKMIFNFDSSNAGLIYKQAMAELVTCGRGAISGLSRDWQNGSRAKMKTLPPHPNIVRVERAIIDRVPDHPDFAKMHPALLPYPAGFGRSSAMFLVMKRYECTLKEFLQNHDLALSTRYILALQLLQGVGHLERNNVVHRDLKCNNILIERDSTNLPRLVISDFGCAFVPWPEEDMTFPFLSPNYDIRNGNPKIQPPEISNCQPGPLSVLDYRKSDAWAAGLLLCKIMGIDENQLNNETYEGEDGEFVFMKRLIKLLLKQDPRERISCKEAARILHLQLFGPKFRKENRSTVHNFHEGLYLEAAITNWLLLHASETVAYKSTYWGKDSVACELFTSFLSTLSQTSLTSAFVGWQSLKQLDG